MTPTHVLVDIVGGILALVTLILVVQSVVRRS